MIENQNYRKSLNNEAGPLVMVRLEGMRHKWKIKYMGVMVNGLLPNLN